MNSPTSLRCPRSLAEEPPRLVLLPVEREDGGQIVARTRVKGRRVVLETLFQLAGMAALPSTTAKAAGPGGAHG